MKEFRRFLLPHIHTGGLISMSPEESYHVLKVLRRKIGAHIGVFDGQGREGIAEIVDIQKNQAIVKILESSFIERELPLEIHLYLAICKEKGWVQALKGAVELGVQKITPFISHRSLAISGEKREKKRERWQKIAEESSKQCGGTRIAQIQQIQTIEDLDFQEDIMVFGLPQGRALVDLPEESWSKTSLAFVIGPEGGFTGKEVELLQKKGCLPCSLGPRILRVETAAVSLVSSWLALYQLYQKKEAL